MQLTLNKRTALSLFRLERARRKKRGLPHGRIPLLAPDPSPGKRWTKPLLDPRAWGLPLSFALEGPIDICARTAGKRPRSRHLSSTVYGTSIPKRSFLRLNEHVAISCPELLFAELASCMSPFEHLLLGLELCGGFSLDAARPHSGKAVMEIPAATSTAKIAGFLQETKSPFGAKGARRTLDLLADSAWSPAEALVAALMALPLDDAGYGIGRLLLNPRYETPERLAFTTDKGSRVPDIMVAGTKVGINYDGQGHLDLESVARAGMALGQEPGSRHREFEVECAKRSVRSKVLDDIRRNRELAADGLVIFPMCKEDLYEYGGLDRVMMQVLVALEIQENWDVREQMDAIRSGRGKEKRQKLIWSAMPGGPRF